MSTLMVSISGIRGVIGDSLLPSVVNRYVSAFGHIQRTKFVTTSSKLSIVVGRDSRVSGPWVERLVEGLLLSLGFHVISVGIVPTPTVQVQVLHHSAVGGVIVTSSHNPVQWNGLKFVDVDGLFLSPERCEEMFAIAKDVDKAVKYPPFDQHGTLVAHPTAIQEHIDLILKLPFLKLDQIRAKKYKVCLDAINGAGGEIMTRLLQTLGCEVIGINADPSGIFAHEPEPIPENLGQLCQAVKQHKADLGIAVDPDVDRCVLIDETGKPIGEEYTLTIAVKYILGYTGKKGAVCKNLSSSRAIRDVAESFGCACFDSKVGEIHVAKAMLEHKAVIGGEGNGGVMLPDVHIGRDAPVAAAIALQMLAIFGESLSKLKASLPQWEIVKLKTPIQGIDADSTIEKIIADWTAKGAKINTADGVRIDSDEFWVHLRKSNTEPIVRVIGEARTVATATKVCEEFMAQIRGGR